MSIGSICTRTVVVIDRNESATEAAKLMRQHHVGDLVVINERDDARKPLGVVTDRDIVVSVVALGVVPDRITVGDIMSSKAHTRAKMKMSWKSLNACAAWACAAFRWWMPAVRWWASSPWTICWNIFPRAWTASPISTNGNASTRLLRAAEFHASTRRCVRVHWNCDFDIHRRRLACV